ncbi:non-catalytic caspase homolog csp-3-like [Clavelina lepadiformis]|uniref:non-catalytic caspase homolog csp-3-like n=1 Tax=Clavelina lepadiformis TaxID=159417 RepID=UPI004042ABE5
MTFYWLRNEAQADGEGNAKDNADMLFAFATASGNSAYRDEVNGSWFTTSLSKVLMEEAKDEDLLSMLTKAKHWFFNSILIG